VLSEQAYERLRTIGEHTELGSGFKIAMRDLEIRGAGNLLGAAQSGFIGAVGFETYVQLLADAIAERKGTMHAAAEKREAVIDVKLDAFVPNDYIPQVSQKIAVYQQLAGARTLDAVEEITASVRDRFGPLPEPLTNLVEITQHRAEFGEPRAHAVRDEIGRPQPNRGEPWQHESRLARVAGERAGKPSNCVRCREQDDRGAKIGHLVAHVFDECFRGGTLLRADGRVRFLGITGHHDPAVLLEAMTHFDFDTILIPLNAADVHYLSFIHQVLPAAERQGIGVIAMKVFSGGKLLGRGRLTPAHALRLFLILL